MTREQYNEFLSFRHTINTYAKKKPEETTCYISTGFCSELKKKENDLLNSFGFYPVRIGYSWFDRNKEDGEKIIYTYFGTAEAWHEVTLQSEREEFCKALND